MIEYKLEAIVDGVVVYSQTSQSLEVIEASLSAAYSASKKNCSHKDVYAVNNTDIAICQDCGQDMLELEEV